MNKMTLAAAILAATGLTACSTDDSSTAFCATFADTATFDLACASGCTVVDEAKAYDGDLDTAAMLTPNDGATEAGLVFTVTQSPNLQVGSIPGVFVSDPDEATPGAPLIRLFRDGNTTPVHTSTNPDNRVGELVDEGSAAEKFLGVKNTPAFDEVEFATSYSWSSGETPVYYVYEICSDGGA